ncbi:C40 family peptidase [Ornithinimicrobium murale]|uniref:C40 family peptidase n=1 Tax=Ornithinimicrobium murale TaxID=1050153 RepID=UPI000E0DD612|nr:C40 family peptidase [Ornithinimicrobium murale]
MRNTNRALGLSLAGTVAVTALVAASLTGGASQTPAPTAETVAAQVNESPVAMLMTDAGPAAQRDQPAASRSRDRELVISEGVTPQPVVAEPVVATKAPADIEPVYSPPLGFTGITPAPEPAPEPAAEPVSEPVQADEPVSEPAEVPAQLTSAPAVQSEPAPEPEPAPAPAPPSNSGGVLGIAASYVGTPYSLGASGPGAFDCSGYTSYVFAQVGINLPRSAAAQQSYATPVSNPAPGDLVFWGYPAYHVGIYAGNGMVYDAGNPGTGVIYRSVFSGVSGYGRV